jgi:DNA processing protein
VKLSAAERLDWLRLARAETVGAVTFRELIRRYRTPAAAIVAIPELARRGGRASPPRIPAASEIAAEIEAGEALGAALICACEDGFPRLLAGLDPPPPILWVRGRAALAAAPGVAIVGARIASAAGQRFARELAREVGQAGYPIVSGLARGVDAAAHQGALASGTVAVLGGGVDDVYPPEHAGLYAQIAEAGCLVSESPPGAKAQARDFPRRNRLISGLSLAVVVVEAEFRSGSLITARLAAEQGREVLAVPGSPLDPRAKGTNDLIRQGAAICEGLDDVLRAIASGPSVREDAEPYAAGPEGEADAALLRRIAALLSPTPVSRDELARISGASAGAVGAALVELALAGEAELLPGGMVVRA